MGLRSRTSNIEGILRNLCHLVVNSKFSQFFICFNTVTTQFSPKNWIRVSPFAPLKSKEIKANGQLKNSAL